jgi:ferredoxin-NADP reductase
MGVEIDGVRRTRTYSPAGSALAGDGRLELTATVHPEGLVSGNLFSRVRPGTIVHLGPAQGEFVLPDVRPERLALISGGSGITPVLSILRTLCDEGYAGDVSFIHFARTRADWLYRAEVEALAAARGNLNVSYVATREGGGRLCEDDLAGRYAAVCGAQSLLDAARSLCEPGRLLTETFTPPSLSLSGAAASGELRFVGSGVAVPIGAGTLLEQAEAAGLSPEFGCRMGICRTCTCRKTAGAVRNVLTDEISEEEDEDIQLCVSVPAGDVALAI